MSHIVLLLFRSFMFHRKGFELSAYFLRMSSLKWDMSQPSKMIIARKTMQKLQQYQISRHYDCPIFKHFEIWYPILICLYLGSWILSKNHVGNVLWDTLYFLGIHSFLRRLRELEWDYCIWKIMLKLKVSKNPLFCSC